MKGCVKRYFQLPAGFAVQWLVSVTDNLADDLFVNFRFSIVCHLWFTIAGC
jgi:hypothetical protein